MAHSQNHEAKSVSDITTFELVALDELESPITRQGADYWDSLRGTRRYPARKELHPRDFSSILRHMLLIKVVEGGSDFEFRIAGDAQVRAYSVPILSRRLSEIAQTSPVFCYGLRGMFLHVTETGAPVAIRGRIGPIFFNVQYAFYESLVLPLGDGDNAVDHLLVFSTYVSRAFAGSAS